MFSQRSQLKSCSSFARLQNAPGGLSDAPLKRCLETKHLQSGPAGTPPIKVFNTVAMVSINNYMEAWFKQGPHHLLHQKIICKKDKKKSPQILSTPELDPPFLPPCPSRKGKESAPLSHTGPLLQISTVPLVLEKLVIPCYGQRTSENWKISKVLISRGLMCRNIDSFPA